MFAGHLPELLIVLVLALVVFGPKRLPEIGGSLGKGIREFKKSTSELQDHMSGHDSAPSHSVAVPVPPVEVRTSTAPESPMPPPAATVGSDTPTV